MDGTIEQVECRHHGNQGLGRADLPRDPCLVHLLLGGLRGRERGGSDRVREERERVTGRGIG